MPVAAVNGHPQAVARAFGSTRACAECGLPFVVTSITGRQRFCAERCKDRSNERTPRARRANRLRFEAWYDAKRGPNRQRQPWLLGPPLCAEYLPGCGLEVHISPAPRYAIEHRNIRMLHGLITEIIGEPHHPTVPGFALVPWPRGCGWGVWIRDESIARRLAGTTCSGVIFDRPVSVRFSPAHRVKAPVIATRGRRLVRVDVISTTVIRSMGGTVGRTAPTAGNICSTLASWLPPRVGVSIAPGSVRVDMIECRTQPDTVLLGGKFGAVRGFVGYFIVETNSVGHWLLKASETVGLGGRTAFGFGRVRVSDVG